MNQITFSKIKFSSGVVELHDGTCVCEWLTWFELSARAHTLTIRTAAKYCRAVYCVELSSMRHSFRHHWTRTHTQTWLQFHLWNGILHVVTMKLKFENSQMKGHCCSAATDDKRARGNNKSVKENPNESSQFTTTTSAMVIRVNETKIVVQNYKWSKQSNRQ